MDNGSGREPLDKLAAEQGVKPVKDPASLLGGWPGDPDDGFEAEVDQHRHYTTGYVKKCGHCGWYRMGADGVWRCTNALVVQSFEIASFTVACPAWAPAVKREDLR